MDLDRRGDVWPHRKPNCLARGSRETSSNEPHTAAVYVGNRNTKMKDVL